MLNLFFLSMTIFSLCNHFFFFFNREKSFAENILPTTPHSIIFHGHCFIGIVDEVLSMRRWYRFSGYQEKLKTLNPEVIRTFTFKEKPSKNNRYPRPFFTDCWRVGGNGSLLTSSTLSYVFYRHRRPLGIITWSYDYY